MSDFEIYEEDRKLECRIPLLPLRDILVFPSTVVPLFVGREKSIQALDHAMAMNKEILLVAQMKAKTHEPEPQDLYSVGTVSTILQILRLPDGTVKVLIEGLRRAKIQEFLSCEPYFLVKAENLEEVSTKDVENEALVRSVKIGFDNYVRLSKRVPPEMQASINQVEQDGKLADTLAAHLHHLKLSDRQKLLEEVQPRKRLEELYGFIQSEIEIIKVEKKIRARVKRQMEKTQKEYYLNEQMAAIQKELGERDDARSDIQEMEKLLESKKMPKEAHEKIKKELKKLKTMSAMSAEAAVVRNYIETVLSLPWNIYTEDIKDIHHAEMVLNRDHYGLDKVKDRILEYLAVKTLCQEIRGPILCLVGPPGVGKTSLAKSMAESLGRKFVRIALGGVKDQAEIRGHRKTYIGSMPGKILMGLKKAGTSNPLMLFDEIDKLGNDYKGDPAAALLEVLDPEQNFAFNDHYLDLDYDLSRVFFMATANTLDGIPAPLLDRMEVVRIAGYTEEEKTEIAGKYLIAKQLQENGMASQKVTFHPKSIVELIRYYTREAGVRGLEREISSLLRKVARKHLKKLNKKGESGDFSVHEMLTARSVQHYLGPRRYRVGFQESQPEIGICTGLAWTSVGGDLLTIEVTPLPGKGKLIMTGTLGNVMQESAHAALSYVRSRATFLGLEENFYQNTDIHVHVPEGAIPKDGPSAGLGLATALASALTKRPIDGDVAMTGEITLRGRSLPIGGLKEKALAAHRGGIKKILFPKENLKDLSEIPKGVQKDVDFIPVAHMDEVLFHAFVWSDKEDELYLKLLKSQREKKTSFLSVKHKTS